MSVRRESLVFSPGDKPKNNRARLGESFRVACWAKRGTVDYGCKKQRYYNNKLRLDSR